MKKRAWLLGLVIMAALLTLAAAALASGGGNIAGQNQVGGEPSSTGRTDDPAGRVQVPVPAVDAPKNNIRAMEAEEATPLDRTDDPLGRVQIPAVYDPPAGSNLDRP